MIARRPPGARTLTALLLLAPWTAAQEWVQLLASPPERSNAVHDPQRARLVVFDPRGETWELDGTTMLHRAFDGTRPRPAGRTRAAMVHDPGRRHVLLFGGDANGTLLGDTWVYDGAQWRELTSPAPSPRAMAATVYDPVRDRVLLFGGTAAVANETWQHDGSRWTRLQPRTSPPDVVDAAMAFDVSRGVAVLVVAPRTGVLQVWEHDGSDWRRRFVNGVVPTGRTGFAVAHDPRRARTVLVGGDGPGQLLEWDGAAWHLGLADPAVQRVRPAAWFDAVAGRVRIGGGEIAGVPDDRILDWDGATLTLARAASRPPPGPWPRAQWFDPVRGRLFMFGDLLGGTAAADLWSWDGRRWQRLPHVGPSARVASAATFDAGRGTGWVFGGTVGATDFADLWRFDGSGWQLADVGTGPSARSFAALAVDEARGRLVLFGGLSPTHDAETWEWDGSSWTPMLPSLSPSPRAGAALGFDPTRNALLLFGGVAAGGVGLTDLWSWNGVTWTRIATNTIDAQTGPVLFFDPDRQRMQLAGPRRLGSSRLDLLELVGNAWQARTSLAMTEAAYSHSWFDPVRRQATTNLSGLVFAHVDVAARVTSFGLECGASPPRLAARSRPGLGDPEFGLEAASVARSPGPVVFGVAGAAGTLPVGSGCSASLGPPLFVEVRFPSAGGVSLLRVPLPADPALRGTTLLAQAVEFDVASGAASLSTGLQFTIGDR